jgi:Neuraminidase (sialidase)
MAPAPWETVQTSQPAGAIGDIKGLAQALRADEHDSWGQSDALGESRSKELRDYTAMTDISPSPWGDDEQSLPLFSGFMNPPPACAPSPHL